MNKNLILINNLSLQYEIYQDKTDNLKEYVINLFRKNKHFSHRKTQHLALNGIDLQVNKGDRIGIIGGNGAGKSSLLKVISGIYTPTAGSIRVNGTVQPLIELGAGFDPEFSGRENIYLNSYMLGFSKKQVEYYISDIIQFCELEEFIDVPIKYYSSGMIVRLAFTIATSIEPDILLVDEMLSAGDAKFIRKALSRMKELVSQANAIVVVSHDLEIIKELCTRVVWMEKGEIKNIGPAEEIILEYSKSSL